MISYNINIPPPPENQKQPKVLNVGGNSKKIPLPPVFNGYEHLLLDIDPKGNPDVLCDARKLDTLPAAQFDAIYNSHNLEHYHKHEVPKVLAGFKHVLKPNGFVYIRVPDIREVMQLFLSQKIELDGKLYDSSVGPITTLDVIYGWGKEIEESGVDFFAHKTGFDQALMSKTLTLAGFQTIYIGTGNLEVQAIAFVGKPDQEVLQKFGVTS